MTIVIEEIEGGVTKVVLSGRLDIAGSAIIDPPLIEVGDSRHAVVVDLADVTFMASLALRSIVMAGKAMRRKGGRMVLLSPQPAVEEVITTSGIDELFPIRRDLAGAVAAATA